MYMNIFILYNWYCKMTVLKRINYYHKGMVKILFDMKQMWLSERRRNIVDFNNQLPFKALNERLYPSHWRVRGSQHTRAMS